MNLSEMQFLTLPWGRQSYFDLVPVELPDNKSAPVVVLLHDSGCDAADWETVVTHLPRDWRVILPDFRGHGKSTAPQEVFAIQDLADDILALLKHLAVPTAILAGHGLGGMVALDLTRQLESKADQALVLVDGLALVEVFPQLAGQGAFRQGHTFGRMKKTETEMISRKYRAMRDRIDPRYFDRLWSSAVQFNAEPFLAETNLPVTLIYGDVGRDMNTENRLHIPKRPQFRWIWIENAGHYLPQEAPEQLATALKKALNTGSPE